MISNGVISNRIYIFSFIGQMSPSFLVKMFESHIEAFHSNKSILSILVAVYPGTSMRGERPRLGATLWGTDCIFNLSEYTDAE